MKNLLPLDDDVLFKLMTRFLPKNYFLEDRDDDTVHILTRHEFSRVQDILRKLYDTQEDPSNSNSHFDAVESDFAKIIHSRICSSEDYTPDSDGVYVYRESPTSDTTILTPAQLLRVLKRWWIGTDFLQMERLIGYSCYDFDPEDGYQEFVNLCNEWWYRLSFADKLGTWRENR